MFSWQIWLYRPPASNVFMDLQAYAHDRFYIVCGADIKYTEKKTFEISLWMMLYWIIYVKKKRN